MHISKLSWINKFCGRQEAESDQEITISYRESLVQIKTAGNYYYPFDHLDLKKHDRKGYEMIEQAWE